MAHWTEQTREGAVRKCCLPPISSLQLGPVNVNAASAAHCGYAVLDAARRCALTTELKDQPHADYMMYRMYTTSTIQKMME